MNFEVEMLTELPCWVKGVVKFGGWVCKTFYVIEGIEQRAENIEFTAKGSRRKAQGKGDRIQESGARRMKQKL